MTHHDDFIKKVALGEVPGFTIDPDNPMLSFTSADIYSKKGTKVRYTGHNGTEADLNWANKYLKVDEIYTLSKTEVGGWHTDFYLEEIPGKTFNSVHFAEVV